MGPETDSKSLPDAYPGTLSQMIRATGEQLVWYSVHLRYRHGRSVAGPSGSVLQDFRSPRIRGVKIAKSRKKTQFRSGYIAPSLRNLEYVL